jgi:hypothetical protein
MQDARRKTIPLRKSLFLAPAAVLALIPGFNNAIALAQNPADQSASHDSLKAGFENPPNSARPRVWWHWMNGNITQEGIKLDLEWMHRVGIGGFQNFDAALGTPQVVKTRLPFMTPEWKNTFLYATKLADQLGMEEAIAGSPGWSETGGPWVKPAEGMKKYVWSELRVEGGKPFHGTLPHPPGNTGAFQNMGNHDMITEGDPIKGMAYYADSAVVAYKLPEKDISLADLHPKVTTSSAEIDAAALSDGDYLHGVSFPAAEVGQKSWILYDFNKPTTVQAITLVMGGTYNPMAMFFGFGDSGRDLEASDDGQTFRKVAHLESGAVGTTTSFAPVSARYFRVTFLVSAPPPNPFADVDIPGLNMPKADAHPPIQVAELVLHSGARVNRFEDKAAFSPKHDLYQFATAAVAADAAVDKSSVVNLTGKMKEDGTLDWTPPAGNWIILRIGYSLIGITNHPASAEATGLEVDKLNAKYVRGYMDHYLDMYKSAIGPEWMGKRGLKYVITDSWEAGAQNWTDDMIAEFQKRRGYDPIPWLPVLTGHVVESAQASDQFLWDLRKTIADLTADEHYGQVEDSLHAHGMGHYGESHESGRAFIADGMEVKKLNEVPMSAMWTQSPGVNKDMFGYNADDRESASVAHIYGQNLAAAESMTASAAPWAWSPATLKPTADKELAEGINRFVIHCSVHQPLVGNDPPSAPGLGLGPFGQWFTRNETWAEQAGAWVSYLGRSSYMLQQGRFAADILYYYGEDSNVTAIFADKNPPVPEGYGFDYINADGLIHEFTVSDGMIKTKSGMSYRVLALDDFSKHMSLPVLRAIHKLVEEGATVSGPKPTDTPSMADDQAEFKKLSDQLFGDGSGEHTVGKGHVYAGETLAEVLPKLNLAPDFDYSKPESDSSALFVHRKTADADIYFVDNRSDHAENLETHFRITGKAPEIWHAETGKSEAASYATANGLTTVPLHLDPWGAVFVVFRKYASAPAKTLPSTAETPLTTVEGPWNVTFQEHRGAPASTTMDKLISFSDSSDAGIKYFSGTATYTKTIDAPQAWFAKGAQLWIDLGDVKNLAEVVVNGKSLGIVWHSPYRVDATAALKPGKNKIVVKATNAWVNRLIGDQQPNATKVTFTVIHPYKANSPLLPSGLLGPVTVIQAAAK